jgi:hypothetical protein
MRRRLGATAAAVVEREARARVDDAVRRVLEMTGSDVSGNGARRADHA